MSKEVHNIINNIFYSNKEFKIDNQKDEWVYIVYKENKFINVYINKNDDFTIIFYYENNKLVSINKYNINKKIKYYAFINIKNRLEFLHEKKMVTDGMNINHLDFFQRNFNYLT